ncbi:MAG: 2-oxoacid:acceptor oxidoreductase family protein [Candidatus Diapherotrites archaeon]
MIEVRIHGRGGQGVKKSAQIIARAAYLSGFQTQDFAVYGAERQGAPVTSFVRIDRKPIELRGYIFEPDFIIILDDTIERKKTLSGAKKETKVLINSHEKIEKKNFWVMDATSIALQETGRQTANIAMLGAFLKLFLEISFEKLEEAVRIELGAKKEELISKNMNAARKCFEMVKQ